MTWKEFKQVVEDAGVKDEQEMAWIDVDYPTDLSLDIDVDINGNGSFKIDG